MRLISVVKHLLCGVIALLIFVYSLEESLLLALITLGTLAVPAIRYKIPVTSWSSVKQYYFDYQNYHLGILIIVLITLVIIEETRDIFVLAIIVPGLGIPYLIMHTPEAEPVLDNTADRTTTNGKFQLKSLVPSASFCKFGILFSIGFAVSPFVLAMFAGGMAAILMLLTVPIGAGLFVLFLALLLVQKYWIEDLSKNTDPESNSPV
jgi:hypothetical protein